MNRKETAPAGHPPAGAAPAYRPRRAAQPATLDKQTIRWMANLPAHVRPTEVAVRFPHIANRFARLWHVQDKAAAYFDDLMFDRRGGRKGFPADVAFELAVLKGHHDSIVRKARQNAWNDVDVR